MTIVKRYLERTEQKLFFRRAGAAAMCAVFGSAQPVFALDLLEAYAKARDNDAQYAAEQSAYQAAVLNAELAKAGLRPSLSLGGSKKRSHTEFRPNGGGASDQSVDTTQLGLSASQLLFDRATQAAAKQGELGAEIAGVGFQQNTQALMLRVTEKYFDLLVARDRKALADSAKAAVDGQLELAQQRLDVGLGTITDRYDAEARASLAEADVISAENAILDAQQALALVIGGTVSGATPLAKLRDTEAGLSGSAARPLADWQRAATENSLAIKQAQLAHQQAQLEQKKAEAARWPSVSLSGNYGVGDTTESGNTPAGDSENWDVALSVGMPIYQGGALRAQQKQAGYQLNEAASRLAQAEREVDSGVASAYRGAQALQRQAEALAQAVIASESALAAKQEGFNAGITTNIDVLNAQSALFSAQNDYLNARYNLLLAELGLAQAAGTLSEADLSAVNQRLSE